MTIRLFEVGGCVRDDMLGVASKDIDFAVEAASFDAMRDSLVRDGFDIFLETPEFFTIRARFPRTSARAGLTADFVLCRSDGPMTDGRRPDFVLAGTIFDDLRRRDFTVNAMARDEDGVILDPHEGRVDLLTGTLRAVGDPFDRLGEDALRALRAIRFCVTKGFALEDNLRAAMATPALAEQLRSVSKERQREEMLKAMHHDTLATLDVLGQFPHIRDAVFSDGLWLKPTLEG
jgi:tRNA nucleotidyltransferase (CCA-adding enzyme)